MIAGHNCYDFSSVHGRAEHIRHFAYLLQWIQFCPVTVANGSNEGGNLGGPMSFMVSMTTKIFGRLDFSAAYSVISPLCTLMAATGFAFTGLFVTILPNLFGQMYAGTYVGLIFVCIISFILVALTDDRPIQS